MEARLRVLSYTTPHQEHRLHVSDWPHFSYNSTSPEFTEWVIFRLRFLSPSKTVQTHILGARGASLPAMRPALGMKLSRRVRGALFSLPPSGTLLGVQAVRGRFLPELIGTSGSEGLVTETASSSSLS